MERVYLDICSLKRPFDDQRQPRVREEAMAVAAIVDVPLDAGARPAPASSPPSDSVRWNALHLGVSLGGPRQHGS